MAKEIPYAKIIDSTRKAARGAVELGASLYELVNSLQAEAIKQQESKDDGPETTRHSG